MTKRNYLINFDSNIRSASEVKANISKYEQLPYDGMVFDYALVESLSFVSQKYSWTYKQGAPMMGA